MRYTSPQRDPGNTPTVTILTTSEAAQPLVAELPLPEEVTERYLEIRTVPEQQVITVIEILSSSNKLTREGRAQYEGKRLNPTATLDLALSLTPLFVRQIRAVIAPLDPGHKGEDLLNRRRTQGQDDLQ